MTEGAATLMHHRKRLNEIASVLVRHGLAAWAARGAGIAGVEPVEHLIDGALTAEERDMSEGERLRGALMELGTTFIKFGQMLSLRPDVVGEDIAKELSKLQASVPPDPPGVAQATVEAELGKPVADLYSSFEVEPFASGSVAQVHRAALPDGTPVAVKVLHNGADVKVRDDVALMAALAAYLEEEDPELAQLRPKIVVAEFATMVLAAIDLAQEQSNLQRFHSNFADEPDVVIPTPYPALSGHKVLTMAMISGRAVSDRASVEAAGWDVDALVHRSAEVYLTMIFRDGLYHADPHPRNFLLPDAGHIAILDFGDVGQLTGQRREQLEEAVIAVGTRNVDSLIDVILDLTTPPPAVDLNALRADLEMWIDRYFFAGVGYLDMNVIMSSGARLFHDHKLVLPADLSLLFRVVLNLQGLGRGVGTEVRVTELLRPYLAQMMAMRFDPKRMARHVGRSVRSWDHFVAGLPDELHAILEQVTAGKVGVDFRVHDADHAVDRLVDGLITAAAVIAGAELVSRRAGPMVRSFSVPGLVATGVAVVSWQRLIARRRTRRSWVSRARRAVEAARQ